MGLRFFVENNCKGAGPEVIESLSAPRGLHVIQKKVVQVSSFKWRRVVEWATSLNHFQSRGAESDSITFSAC